MDSKTMDLEYKDAIKDLEHFERRSTEIMGEDTSGTAIDETHYSMRYLIYLLNCKDVVSKQLVKEAELKTTRDILEDVKLMPNFVYDELPRETFRKMSSLVIEFIEAKYLKS